MSLRTKFASILLLISALMYIGIQHVWLPRYLQFEQQNQIRTTKAELELVGQSIASDLFARDYSALHQVLTDAHHRFSHWKSLTLYDNEKTQVYPLAVPDSQKFTITDKFFVPILFQNEIIGELHLKVDLTGMALSRISRIGYLLWSLLALMLVFAAISYFLQDRWIIYPLDKLGAFAGAVAKGDYSICADYSQNDEIGKLYRAYERMRSQVESREISLKKHKEIDQLIYTIQKRFIADQDKHYVFSELNERIIRITGSEFGFIGEVIYDDYGVPTCKAYSDDTCSWGDETREPFVGTGLTGVEVNYINKMVGEVLKTAREVVSDGTDYGNNGNGVDHGQPTIRSFLGLPIRNRLGFFGILVLVNWAGDYQDIFGAGEGRNLLSSLASLFAAYRDKEALTESEMRLRSVIETAVDAVICVDKNGLIKIFNPAAERIFGYSRDEMIGKSMNALLPDNLKSHHNGYLSRQQNNQNSGVIGVSRELEARHKTGISIPIELSVSRVKTSGGIEFTGIIRDISGRKKHEKLIRDTNLQLSKANKELEQLAVRDGLTNLYNRRYFDEALNTECGRAHRKAKSLTLMLLDVDYFKNYNDNHGHQAGDNCLKLLSGTIKRVFSRASDIIARYGGEEFAIIIPELGYTDAKRMAEKLRKEVMDTAIVHGHSNVSSVVTISVGVATLMPKNKCSVYEFVEAADKALYTAKTKGRNCVHCVKVLSLDHRKAVS